MIDIENVKRITALLGGYESDEIEQYSPIIENAAAVVNSSLKNGDFETDVRVIYLAATKANYDISLVLCSGGDNITSFTAGDVKIVEGGDNVAYARRLYENAQIACKSLVADNGFCFKCV